MASHAMIKRLLELVRLCWAGAYGHVSCLSHCQLEPLGGVAFRMVQSYSKACGVGVIVPSCVLMWRSTYWSWYFGIRTDSSVFTVIPQQFKSSVMAGMSSLGWLWAHAGMLPRWGPSVTAVAPICRMGGARSGNNKNYMLKSFTCSYSCHRIKKDEMSWKCIAWQGKLGFDFKIFRGT